METIWVEKAQTPTVLLKSNFWKYVSNQYLIGVSFKNVNIFPFTDKLLQVVRLPGVKIDEEELLKRRID